MVKGKKKKKRGKKTKTISTRCKMIRFHRIVVQNPRQYILQINYKAPQKEREKTKCIVSRAKRFVFKSNSQASLVVIQTKRNYGTKQLLTEPVP